MRNLIQPQRWFAHLADARPQRGHMLGTQIGVMTERRLEFVLRLSRDASRQYLEQSLEDKVIPLVPRNALDHGHPWPLSRLEITQARQRRYTQG